MHYDLALHDRDTAPITFEAVSSLVDFYLDGYEPSFSPPLALGHDLQRKFGESGFGIFCELMTQFEPPLLPGDMLGEGDPRTPTNWADYDSALTAQWVNFANRPFREGLDHLLIDAMAKARADGWQIRGDLRVTDDNGNDFAIPRFVRPETEAILDDLANRSGAKRAEKQAEITAREKVEDEAAEHLWEAYQLWKANGEPLTDPLIAEHAHRKLVEDQYLARKTRQYPLPQGSPMPAPLSVVPAAPLPDLMTSAASFIAGYAPPDYLIDGLMQRRYLYSLTAKTGVGKTAIAMRWAAHVASGRMLGDREVQQGVVIYCAGENPDDVRARWLALSRSMGIDPGIENMIFIVGTQGGLSHILSRIGAEVAAKGLTVAMVIIDTGAAYFGGDNDNDNTQMGNYAREMRWITQLPGGPCVVGLMHPTKNASEDDLVPRGGSAFMNEVDGNLAVRRKESLLVVSPHGKYRGDMSVTLRYELEVVRDHPLLKDTRGRHIPSVIVRPVGDGTAAALEKTVDRDTELVLDAVYRTPGASPTDLARVLAWTFGVKHEPNLNRVKRNLSRLRKEKLVAEKLGRWRIQPAGEKELNAIEVGRTLLAPARVKIDA